MTKEVIAASENGHNILILGSVGTGKSHLVKKYSKRKFGKCPTYGHYRNIIITVEWNYHP